MPWILEIENATQCGDSGVFSLFAQVIMAFADSFTHKLSKSAYPSPFFRFLQGAMGELLSWACQVGHWNFLTSQVAPVTSLLPRGAPPGPNDVTEAQASPRAHSFQRGAAAPGACWACRRGGGGRRAGVLSKLRAVLRKASPRKGTDNQTLQKCHLSFLWSTY